MSWIYQRDSGGHNVLGNFPSRDFSWDLSSGKPCRLFQDTTRSRPLSPMDVLKGAPVMSGINQEQTLTSYKASHNETRMCEFRPPGSERIRHRQALVQELLANRCRLLIVHGEILSGKAYFAEEVIQDLRRHCCGSLEDVVVRCLGIPSWESLMASLASGLGCPEPYTDNTVKTRVREITTRSRNSRLVLLFTNFEDIVSSDELLRRASLFLKDLLETNQNLSVVVTSRVNVVLTNQFYTFSYKLDPPSEGECCRLLEPIRTLCKTYEPIFMIVRRCVYRPALILRLRNIILSNQNLVTPEEVAETLNSPGGALELFTKFSSPEGSLTEAIKNQLSRLPFSVESDARTLCDLDGSFGVVEASRKLSQRSLSEFKLKTLLPLCEHAIVRVDIRSQKIQIDPFIRQFILSDTKHVPHNDPFKKLIVDFLGYVLKMMREDISVKTKGRALGFAQDNYQRLEGTLTQAVHTFGEESYNVYMKLIELEEGSMSAVCPSKALPFYKAMVEASAKFGTARDQALLQGLYAVALIELHGDELTSAVSMITDSLNHLTNSDSQTSYFRVMLMRRLGWMNIRLGNNKEAKRWLMEAKAISTRLPEAMEAMVEPHRIQINSHLAIVNVFLGDYPKAHSILKSTIPRASRVMPDHPVLAVLLQTMGLNYEREGHVEKALTSYRLSGNERRKLEATLPSYLVTNLNNQASRHLWRGDTGKALPLLENALNIRRKLGWWDYNTALTLWYRGNAFLFSDRAEEAERSFNQSLEVIMRCTPHHDSNLNVRLALAHAYMAQGREPEAERCLKEALNFTDSFQGNVNDNTTLTTLEHLILLREHENGVGDIHRLLITEVQRLSDVFERVDQNKFLLLQRKLTEWRVYLGQILCRRKKASPRNKKDLKQVWWLHGCDGQSVEKVEDKNVGDETSLSCRQTAKTSGNDIKPEEETALRGSRIDLKWDILFTCEHCKMLNFSHTKWQSTARR